MESCPEYRGSCEEYEKYSKVAESVATAFLSVLFTQETNGNKTDNKKIILEEVMLVNIISFLDKYSC